MHQREEEGEVVRKRNAALQFLFSPVMGRGLLELFICLMGLGNVKAAVVIQEKQDGMDEGHASVLACTCTTCTNLCSRAEGGFRYTGEYS